MTIEDTNDWFAFYKNFWKKNLDRLEEYFSEIKKNETIRSVNTNGRKRKDDKN